MSPLAGEAKQVDGAAADAEVQPPRAALGDVQEQVQLPDRGVDLRGHLHLAVESGVVEPLHGLLQAGAAIDVARMQQQLAPGQ
jgi:hypothetical protein